MNLVTIRSALLWCAVIDCGLLLVGFALSQLLFVTLATSDLCVGRA
jgi:hypothetical protein